MAVLSERAEVSAGRRDRFFDVAIATSNLESSLVSWNMKSLGISRLDSTCYETVTHAKRLPDQSPASPSRRGLGRSHVRFLDGMGSTFIEAQNRSILSSNGEIESNECG